nr:hypothetical protein [Tanacetum cinerariifolium]
EIKTNQLRKDDIIEVKGITATKADVHELLAAPINKFSPYLHQTISFTLSLIHILLSLAATNLTLTLRSLRRELKTEFAEEVNVEFDQIGENARKELEEASARKALTTMTFIDITHPKHFLCNRRYSGGANHMSKTKEYCLDGLIR